MDVDKLTNAEPEQVGGGNEDTARLEEVPDTVIDDATMNEVEAQGDSSRVNKKTGKGATGKAGGKGKGAGKGKGGSNSNVNGSNGNGGGSSITVPPPTFPLARVSRIVKADPDIQMTSKDAIWTIAVATELFIKHLTDSLIAKTKLEKKKIASYKELSAVVDTQEEFEFLQEVIPEPVQAQEAFQFRKELQEQNYQRAVGLLIDEDSDEEEEVEEVEEEQTEGKTQNAEEQTDADAIIQDVQTEEGQTKAKKAGRPKGAAGKGKKQGANATETTDASINEGDANTSVASTGGRKKGANAGKGGRKSATNALQPTDGDEEMQDI